MGVVSIRYGEPAAGFFVVEAESMEEAVEFAKRQRWLPGSNGVREIQAPDGEAAWIGTTRPW